MSLPEDGDRAAEDQRRSVTNASAPTGPVRPTFAADESVVFFPVQFKAVEADHVLQVHQNHHQRVELVSQPEVCEADSVERGRHHTELSRQNGGGAGGGGGVSPTRSSCCFC